MKRKQTVQAAIKILYEEGWVLSRNNIISECIATKSDSPWCISIDPDGWGRVDRAVCIGAIGIPARNVSTIQAALKIANEGVSK